MEYQDEYLYDEDGWTCPECGAINGLEEDDCNFCDGYWNMMYYDRYLNIELEENYD